MHQLINYANKRERDFFTKDEEIALFSEYQQTKSLAIKERIIGNFLRLVIKKASDKRYYKLDQDELIQEGVIGLIKAIDAYDVSLGWRFATLAGSYIDSAMYEFIRNNIHIIKRTKTKPVVTAFFKINTYLDHDGRMTEKAINQMATDLNIPVRDVRSTYIDTVEHDISLDIPFDDNDDGATTMTNTYAGADYSLTPEHIVSQRMKHHCHGQGIIDALDVLDERTRDIIYSHYLDDEPITTIALGLKHGITQQRVSMIEKKGMQLMKPVLEQYRNFI